MTWKITVQPATATLSTWLWTAERADGETTRSGRRETRQEALQEARDMAIYTEAKFAAIAEYTIVEEYTPTQAEVMAAK